jgi:outer membrane protein OmpA-like peptidoglycan-associated protein
MKARGLSQALAWQQGLQGCLHRGLQAWLRRTLPRWFNRCLPRGMHWAMQPRLHRGLERGLERGLHRGLERGLERDLHRGLYRHLSRGATLVEFAVVGLTLSLIGLGIIQYCLLYFARNHINYATFMAARAGSTGNASLDTVRRAYIRALVPLYGGGRNSKELAESQDRAVKDAVNVDITILNPGPGSFSDWNDASKQAQNANRRVIPNAGQAFRNPFVIGPVSHQNIQDANLLKIRVMHGFRPDIPVVGTLYTQFLKAADDGSDAARTRLINAGRIPVISYATLHMQSDALEDAVSALVAPPATSPPTPPPAPPESQCFDCGDPTPVRPNPGADPLTTPPADPDGATFSCGSNGDVVSELPADPLFNFGESTLTAEGKSRLDALVSDATTRDFESVRLVGYTDPIGSAASNATLSRNRSQAVKDYLVANGFPDKPITVEGRGAQDLKVPLASCPYSGQAQRDCLAPNRRVEVIVQGMKKS